MPSDRERGRKRERAGERTSRRASIINAPDKLFASINSAFKHINGSHKKHPTRAGKIHTHIYIHTHTCSIFAVCIYRK